MILVLDVTYGLRSASPQSRPAFVWVQLAAARHTSGTPLSTNCWRAGSSAEHPWPTQLPPSWHDPPHFSSDLGLPHTGTRRRRSPAPVQCSLSAYGRLARQGSEQCRRAWHRQRHGSDRLVGQTLAARPLRIVRCPASNRSPAHAGTRTWLVGAPRDEPFISGLDQWLDLHPIQ